MLIPWGGWGPDDCWGCRLECLPAALLVTLCGTSDGCWFVTFAVEGAAVLRTLPGTFDLETDGGCRVLLAVVAGT